jgi:hypothetical protein
VLIILAAQITLATVNKLPSYKTLTRAIIAAVTSIRTLIRAEEAVPFISGKISNDLENIKG